MASINPSEQAPFGLIADIGGTNARFALTIPGKPGFEHAITLACKDYPGVHEAILDYLRRLEVGTPESICLAIAGVITKQSVKLTNNDWFISQQNLQQQFPDSRIMLINDFTAIALSVPFLQSDHVINVGCEQPHNLDLESFSIGIIGPGTGLGVSGLLKQHGVTIPIISEAGHISFAPYNQQQDKLLSTLRERWPRISVERLVSGSGAENIFWALTRINGEPETHKSASEIFEAAINNEDCLEHEAVSLFFQILGQVAGDIAMAFGAENGVYIAGGVAMRYPDLLVSSQFREAFENKGRHSRMVTAIPTFLIIHPQPGLLGASVAMFSAS